MAKKRPDSDYARALWLRDMGCTYRVIGEEFDVTASRALQMARRGGKYALTRPSRSFPSWDDGYMGHLMAKRGKFDATGRRRKPVYGNGSTAWQWRDWNEWVATPAIGRNDDNTAGFSNHVAVSWPA